MTRSTSDSEERVQGLSERMVSFFGPDGILSMSGGFEFRPQQQDMARAVSEALISSSPLIVEAEIRNLLTLTEFHLGQRMRPSFQTILAPSLLNRKLIESSTLFLAWWDFAMA
jgi:hypothetical protein